MKEQPKVLVVDDEMGPRESLKMILRDDYQVAVAGRGEQALNYISQESYDMVVLDIRMPDINGIDLLKMIKKESPDTEVAMITAYASVETATKALRYGAMDYLIKPFDSKSVKEIVGKGIKKRSDNLAMKLKLDELKFINNSLKEEMENAYRNIKLHYKETVNSLIAAIDAKDSYTKGHQERVANIALALGKAMNLPQNDLTKLKQAAVLHDIGKIGLSEHILNKRSPLTEEEFNSARQHPLIGAKIISPVRSLQDVLPIILYHHEKYDGTGYPYGITGTNIPLCARISAVADAIDAMLSERPYAPPKSFEQVSAELSRCAGSQFDPGVVAVALDVGLLNLLNT